jgi:hypothetical protein
MRADPAALAWILALLPILAIWGYYRLIAWLMAIPCPRRPEPPPLGQKQKLVPKAPQPLARPKKPDGARLKDMQKKTYHLHCMTPIPRRGRAVHFHRLVGWMRLIIAPKTPGLRLPKGLWKGKN